MLQHSGVQILRSGHMKIYLCFRCFYYSPFRTSISSLQQFFTGSHIIDGLLTFWESPGGFCLRIVFTVTSHNPGSIKYGPFFIHDFTPSLIHLPQNPLFCILLTDNLVVQVVRRASKGFQVLVVKRKEHISFSVIHDLTVLADLQNPFIYVKLITMYVLSFAALFQVIRRNDNFFHEGFIFFGDFQPRLSL